MDGTDLTRHPHVRNKRPIGAEKDRQRCHRSDRDVHFIPTTTRPSPSESQFPFWKLRTHRRLIQHDTLDPNSIHPLFSPPCRTPTRFPAIGNPHRSIVLVTPIPRSRPMLLSPCAHHHSQRRAVRPWFYHLERFSDSHANSPFCKTCSFSIIPRNSPFVRVRVLLLSEDDRAVTVHDVSPITYFKITAQGSTRLLISQMRLLTNPCLDVCPVLGADMMMTTLNILRAIGCNYGYNSIQ